MVFFGSSCSMPQSLNFIYLWCTFSVSISGGRASQRGRLLGGDGLSLRLPCPGLCVSPLVPQVLPILLVPRGDALLGSLSHRGRFRSGLRNPGGCRGGSGKPSRRWSCAPFPRRWGRWGMSGPGEVWGRVPASAKEGRVLGDLWVGNKMGKSAPEK